MSLQGKFFGDMCENTCFDPNGIKDVPCNGHGFCQSGCVCDEKFQGDFVDRALTNMITALTAHFV